MGLDVAIDGLDAFASGRKATPEELAALDKQGFLVVPALLSEAVVSVSPSPDSVTGSTGVPLRPADSVAIVAATQELDALVFCVMLGGVEEEAQRVWAELQQRDWVNPDLDLSDVMEKLAHNWDPWSLLARHRVIDTGPIHVQIISGPRSKR